MCKKQTPLFFFFFFSFLPNFQPLFSCVTCHGVPPFLLPNGHLSHVYRCFLCEPSLVTHPLCQPCLVVLSFTHSSAVLACLSFLLQMASLGPYSQQGSPNLEGCSCRYFGMRCLRRQYVNILTVLSLSSRMTRLGTHKKSRIIEVSSPH